MVLNVMGIFGKDTKKGRPLINQIPLNVTHNAAYGVSTVYAQKQKFWKWFRSRPELNAPVMIRVDDTIGEVDYYAKDGSTLGRNTRLQAERFWEENQLYERLKSVQYDRLVTGSGFLWLGMLKNAVVDAKEAYMACLKEVCMRRANSIQGISIRERDNVFAQIYLKTLDEDLRTPRRVDYVPSSTVMIEHDRYDIVKYIQYFSAYSEEFMPDEIIHIPLMRVDGKVDGFTPVESLTYELILLWAIKENMLSYIRNGGSPNKVFILPEEMPNSDNHKWLTQVLMDRGVLENRHGNLVLTGKVEVEDLEGNIKDMEYKELALYVTSNIAYALRVPVSRIPYMIGQAQSNGDAGGLADSGYWSMIESDQRTIEMHLNQQLFHKVGFSVKFRKKYKLDDIREAQALNFRVDAVTKIQNELANLGLTMNKKKLALMLDLSDSDLETLSPEQRLERMGSGLLGKTNAKDRDVMPEKDKQKKAETKQQAGKNNPSGSNQSGY